MPLPSRHPRRPRRPRAVARLAAAFGLACCAAVGGSVLTAGPASADTTPTSMEILAQCGKADLCVFHNNGAPQLFLGDEHQIGHVLTNCGPGSSTQSAGWSDATGETNSIGISLIVANEGGFGDAIGAFKSEFEITYGHKWGTTDTTERTTDVKLDPGQRGWLTRRTPMQRVSGTYELHFGSRFHGHYYWYVPMTVTGPATNQVDTVVQHSAPMTAEERTACA